MKVLLTGDWQINHNRTDYMRFLTDSLTFLGQVIHDRRPDLLVNLGDLMDTKHIVSVEDLVYAWKWVRYLGHIMSEVNGRPSEPRQLLLKGNHDLSDKHGAYSTVQVMEDGQTEVFTENKWVVRGNHTFLVLPYTEDYEALQDWLKEACEADIAGVFGHIDWIGYRMTPTAVSKRGLDPSWYLNYFPDTPVFNGHYHHPGEVGPVNLVGSPLHKDFNDLVTETERGFVLWDTETGEKERISNRHTFYCMNLVFDTKDEMMESHQWLEPLKEYLRVKVFVPHALVEEATEAFEGYLWKSVQPIEQGSKGVHHSAQVSITSTPADIVTKGVEAAPEQYDRKLLTTYGSEAFR